MLRDLVVLSLASRKSVPTLPSTLEFPHCKFVKMSLPLVLQEIVAVLSVTLLMVMRSGVEPAASGEKILNCWTAIANKAIVTAAMTNVKITLMRDDFMYSL